MSKKTDEKLLQDLAAIKKFCEEDRQDAADGANQWRGIPGGGIASIPSARDFIRFKVEQAEAHVAGRLIDLAKIAGAEVTVGIAHEAATEERSANAKKSENKGGRPSLIERARELAALQSKKMKKNSKSVRAKDIQRELEKTLRPEDVPGEDTIRQWDIYE